MSASESHAVRNNVLATVIGGILLAGLTEAWPPAKAAFLWLWGQIQRVIDLLGAVYEMPGWSLLALGLLSLITVVRLLVGYAYSKRGPHMAYVEDLLHGATWRWRWADGDITNLWSFCPTCNGELVYDDSSAHNIYRRGQPSTLFICEHCGRHTVAEIQGGGKEYCLSLITREIRRKVRNEEYSAKSGKP